MCFRLWTCCTLSSVLTFLVPNAVAPAPFVTKRLHRLVSSFAGEKERRKGKKEARKQRGIELILGIEAKEESGLDKEFVIVAMQGTERNRASENGWDFGFCRDGTISVYFDFYSWIFIFISWNECPDLRKWNECPDVHFYSWIFFFFWNECPDLRKLNDSNECPFLFLE
jgi:hypothetical protein